MKFVLLILVSLFIGCAGQEAPPVDSAAPDLEGLAESPAPVLDSNVASQTILTCSKEGAENVVYTAKTYSASSPCKKDEGQGTVRSCLCEVFTGDSVLAMATSTRDWCENSAIDSLMSNQGISISYQGRQKSIAPLHDASYTCTKS